MIALLGFRFAPRSSLLTRQLCCSTEIARQTPRTQTIVRTGSRYPLAVFRGSFCGNQKGERTMLLSRGYLTAQGVMHGAPPPTGISRQSCQSTRAVSWAVLRLASEHGCAVAKRAPAVLLDMRWPLSMVTAAAVTLWTRHASRITLPRSRTPHQQFCERIGGHASCSRHNHK